MNKNFLANDLIYLRAAEPEDLDIMYRMENDPEQWDVASFTVPYSRYTLKQYIADSQNDMFADKQLRLMVVSKKENRVTGTVDLTDFSPLHNRAAIGIGILKEYQNKGFGKMALELLCEYAFGFLRVHQLYAHVAFTNINSKKLFMSLGFEHTATLKDWLRVDKGYEDVLFFQKINNKSEV